MTQPQIAEKVGVARGAIAKWEAGKRQPRAENCRALADLAAGTFELLEEERAASNSQDNLRAAAGQRLLQTERARSLSALARFFRKKAVGRKEIEREEAYAIGQLIDVLREARQGDATAKEFLEASSLDEGQFRSLQRRWEDELDQKRIDRRSDGWHEMIRATANKSYKAETVWRGRHFLVARGFAAVRRELQRLGAKPDDFPELERLIGISRSLGSPTG